MNGRNIETVRAYNFDPKEVIAGLNGYYESDKRNGYITVRRNDVEGPAYLTAALYLSALIEWLREDHDIFYRPGLILDQVEAARSAAKTCCLRFVIKDEISKRGLWCDKDADIPALVDTLFKAYDECKERANKNREDAVKLSKEIRCVVKEKESAIENLKERIAEVESNFKAVCDEGDIFRTRALKAEEEVKKLKEQLNSEQKCYDYLWNALKKLSPDCDALKIDRSFAILQDLYRDIFKKQPDGLSGEDIANKILDRMLETEDLLHKSVDSVNKECKATGRLMVDDYKLKLKDYILKDIKEHGYRYDGLQTKSIEEIVDWIITMATDEWANSEIRNLRGQISRLKGLINAMNEEVGDM